MFRSWIIRLVTTSSYGVLYGVLRTLPILKLADCTERERIISKYRNFIVFSPEFKSF